MKLNNISGNPRLRDILVSPVGLIRLSAILVVLLISVLLLTMGIVLWLMADLARLAPRRVGAIAGILSASSLVGAYLSWRFFYIPPFIFYLVICAVLLTATVQLLKPVSTLMDGDE